MISALEELLEQAERNDLILRRFAMSHYRRSRLYFGASILLALAAITSPFYSAPMANANGFTVPVAQGVSGPYEYLIGVWPSDPVVGKPLLMSIALSANQQPVTNASVNVTGAVDDRAVVIGPVTAINTIGHPATYEFTRALYTPGEWMFQVEIKSPLGNGAVEVPLEVAGSQGATDQAAGNRLIWVIVAVPLVILAFGLAALGFRRHGRAA
jgi:hypothetical protein